MMNRPLLKYFSLFGLLLTTVFNFGLAQSEFPVGKSEKIFFDDFTEKSFQWPTILGNNEVFVNYSNGEYFMKRPVASAKAIQPQFGEIKRNFIIKTSLKLGPVKSTESTLGVYFMFQDDLSGGFIFEFNKKQEYRISQFVSGQIIYLTGEAAEKGWVKNKLINGINEANKIELKAFKGVYEVWINGQYIDKIKLDKYTRGKFGLWLGPESLGKCDYFYVYNHKVEGVDDFDMQELQQKIKILELENTSLRDSILNARFGKGNQDVLKAMKIVEKQLGILNRENQMLHEKLAAKDPNDGSISALSNLSRENQVLRNQVDSLKDVNLKCLMTIDSIHEVYYDKIEVLTAKLDLLMPEEEAEENATESPEKEITKPQENKKEESDLNGEKEEEEKEESMMDPKSVKKVKTKKSKAKFE